jgi:hypothetical protein
MLEIDIHEYFLNDLETIFGLLNSFVLTSPTQDIH